VCVLHSCSVFLGVYSVLCLFYLTTYVYAFAIHSMVHCGSAFEPGASGLPYYCTSICVRSCCNWRASYVDSKPKKKNARGWRNVVRYLHDSNGIIDARSASPLAPDLVAALSDKDIQSFASSPPPCNPKYTMRSNIFVLDRIVSRDRKRCL